MDKRNALVTGASRGIGAAIAKALAKYGYRVIVGFRSDEKGVQETVAEIRDLGGKARAVQADVTKRIDVERMFDEIEKTEGSVSHLVNNAGLIRDAPLLLLSDDDWDVVIDTNLRGTYLCTQLALRGMLHLGGGSITNIVSSSGIVGRAGQTNYSAAKGGVIAFTKALAREMGRYKVRVNSVSPGIVETTLSQEMINKNRDRLLASIPLRRLGTTEEVAAVVRFLASEEASYITGQVISVDGGLT